MNTQTALADRKLGKAASASKEASARLFARLSVSQSVSRGDSPAAEIEPLLNTPSRTGENA